MRNLLSAALTWIGILGVVATAAAQPDAARPTIHRVTVDGQSGVLTITGTGFGPHLVVAVEGTPSTVLAGATETQIEIALPPTLLTSPGTYRLTVVDAVRRLGDAFVVASPATAVSAGAVDVAGQDGNARADAPASNNAVLVGNSAAAASQHGGGWSPMTVIEEGGFPYRTAIGNQALFSNTTGDHNTATGYHALRTNTTGYYNTASGSGALFFNTTGSFNAASGMNALYNNTTGSDNTANGAGALFSNTTGSSNTAIGRDALVSNTSANFNTAIGSSALYANTSGFNNTAAGYQALSNNSTGLFNAAVGSKALYSNTTGAFNVASGSGALFFNTTGVANTASGANSLASNTTGAANTATGFNALSNTTGQSNTAIGSGAGSNVTAGSYNVFIGADVVGTAADSHTIRIGLPYDGGTGFGQNRTFIAGIHDTQLTDTARVVYVDANGQLGTLTHSASPGDLVGGAKPLAQLLQQLQTQEEKLRQLHDLETTVADLRGRLAKLEVLAARTTAGK